MTTTTHTVAHVLGEITWILSQSPKHQDYKISDLEHSIMPALLLKQFRIFYDDNKQPVGFAVWAFVDNDVSDRLKTSSKESPVRLELKEWKSGTEPWIMEIATPYEHENPELINQFTQQLRKTTFSGMESLQTQMK